MGTGWGWEERGQGTAPDWTWVHPDPHPHRAQFKVKPQESVPVSPSQHPEHVCVRSFSTREVPGLISASPDPLCLSLGSHPRKDPISRRDSSWEPQYFTCLCFCRSLSASSQCQSPPLSMDCSRREKHGLLPSVSPPSPRPQHCPWVSQTDLPQNVGFRFCHALKGGTHSPLLKLSD